MRASPAQRALVVVAAYALSDASEVDILASDMDVERVAASPLQSGDMPRTLVAWSFVTDLRFGPPRRRATLSTYTELPRPAQHFP